MSTQPQTARVVPKDLPLVDQHVPSYRLSLIKWPVAGQSLSAGSVSPAFEFTPQFANIFSIDHHDFDPTTLESDPTTSSGSNERTSNKFDTIRVTLDSNLKLRLDLFPMFNLSSGTSRSDELDLWSSCIRWARNCLEHNLTLHSLPDRPDYFRLQADHLIPSGRPLRVWPSADLLAKHHIPTALAPSQIVSAHHYRCNRCSVSYSQPNLLRVHAATCKSLPPPISLHHSIQHLLAPSPSSLQTSLQSIQSSTHAPAAASVATNHPSTFSAHLSSPGDLAPLSHHWSHPALLHHLRNSLVNRTWSDASSFVHNRLSSPSSVVQSQPLFQALETIKGKPSSVCSTAAFEPIVARESAFSGPSTFESINLIPSDRHIFERSLSFGVDNKLNGTNRTNPHSRSYVPAATSRRSNGHRSRNACPPLSAESAGNSSADEAISDRVISSSCGSNHGRMNADISDGSIESANGSSDKPLKATKEPRTHTCMFCGKLYTRKYGLKIHVRTHTGHKPLKCMHCARAFSDPSNLNKHMRLHQQHRLWSKQLHLKKI
jgi:hypothetical protein